MAFEYHLNHQIDMGDIGIDYGCSNCSLTTRIPVKYRVLHQLIEDHGQGVDGCTAERVYIRSDIPELVQCECGNTAWVEIRNSIFSDTRNSSVNLFTGDVVEKGDMGLKYPIESVRKDVQGAFDRVVFKHLGIPASKKSKESV